MVDPRTPVLVGVSQFTERIDDADYRGMSAVELATEATRAALADTAADVAAVARSIEVFAGLRQFEICTPFSDPPLGASDNYLRSVAGRVGADPARAVLEPIGGNGPQKLVTEFASAIAAGGVEVALVVGSEPGSTAKSFSTQDQRPDFTERVGGQLEDRGYGFEQYMSEYTAKHGLTGAPVQYGLLDNARRARLGLGVDEYLQKMAELFSPFSKVAAKNPYSSSPVERSERMDPSVSISAKQAVAEALRVAGIGIADVASFDLYSCFPFPVFAVCDEFGLAPDDPRGLTLTGGLPYFGGPGNSYSLHGIAEVVAELRSHPGSFGLVGANGGVMSKYSVGVYSTEPADWAPDRSKELQAAIAALPTVAVTRNANGHGVIETYSVRYDWPERTGVIIGRLDADGSRLMALATDEDLVALMSDGDPLGARIAVTATEDGINRATLA